MRTHSDMAQYVVCLTNRGYTASLVVRRLYRMIDDPTASKRGLIRVIDESGEDYLYPKRLFAPVDLPSSVARRLAATSSKPAP